MSDNMIWAIQLMDTDKHGRRKFVNFEAVPPVEHIDELKCELENSGFISGKKHWARPTKKLDVFEIFYSSPIVLSTDAIFLIEPSTKNFQFVGAEAGYEC